MNIFPLLSILCYLPALILGKTLGSIQVEGFGEVSILEDFGNVEVFIADFTLETLLLILSVLNVSGKHLWLINIPATKWTSAMWNVGALSLLVLPGNPYYGGLSGNFY